MLPVLCVPLAAFQHTCDAPVAQINCLQNESSCIWCLASHLVWQRQPHSYAAQGNLVSCEPFRRSRVPPQWLTSLRCCTGALAVRQCRPCCLVEAWPRPACLQHWFPARDFNAVVGPDRAICYSQRGYCSQRPLAAGLWHRGQLPGGWKEWVGRPGFTLACGRQPCRVLVAGLGVAACLFVAAECRRSGYPR